MHLPLFVSSDSRIRQWGRASTTYKDSSVTVAIPLGPVISRFFEFDNENTVAPTKQTHTYINTTKQIRKNYRLFMRSISFQLEHSVFSFTFSFFSTSSARVIAYNKVVANFLAIPKRYKCGQCAGTCAYTHSRIAKERKRKRGIALHSSWTESEL